MTAVFSAIQELCDVVGTSLVAYIMTAVFSVIEELSDVVGTPLVTYIMMVCVFSYTRAV